jgi:uncharacterized protein with NRDE domain
MGSRKTVRVAVPRPCRPLINRTDPRYEEIMCTIVAVNRIHPEFPVIIAANRDELYERPSSGPRLLSRHPRSIGGLDLREEGTWLGANERGLFVGVTNQRTHRLPDPSLRSRGQVVRQLLRAGSAIEVRERLIAIDPAAYNPFNLMFGDAEGLYVAYARPARSRASVEPLERGIYVLPNDRLDSPDFPRASRARRLVEEICEQPWPALANSLAEVLGDHHLPPIDEIAEPPADSIFSRRQLHRLQSICIHADGYGTCSATMIALAVDSVGHYLFADGPPCTTSFRDVTSLLVDAPTSSG